MTSASLVMLGVREITLRSVSQSVIVVLATICLAVQTQRTTQTLSITMLQEKVRCSTVMTGAVRRTKLIAKETAMLMTLLCQWAMEEPLNTSTLKCAVKDKIAVILERHGFLI